MAIENEKDTVQLKKRFQELAERSYNQGIFTFTSFLGLSEQDVFWREVRSFEHTGYTVFGGCDNTDRNIIRFGKVTELGYEVPFPIVCIHIKPLLQKFAEDLSHRDFLGALMNLGIDRSTIGDIKVGEKEAYLFCLEQIADFICENLTKIRHTNVSCKRIEGTVDILEEEPEYKTVQVQSLRVDALVAKVFNLSREKSIELFRAGKIFVNGRMCENNSALLKQSEAVSVRGFGKFGLHSEPRETKKGKLSVEVYVYQ